MTGEETPGGVEVAVPILELRDTSKSFGGTPALRGVSFSVLPGRIHALVGENGAGKSTLVNILSGVVESDAGELRLDGVPVHFSAPLEANRHGIHMVHQELALLPEATVAENVFLGGEVAGPGGLLDWTAMRRESAALLRRLDADIDPNARVSGLSVAQRQMVEIARSLVGRARVMILDEPTAALSPHEAEALFAVLRRLRGEGRAIVYISHRIGEVLGLADEITVLKDGRLVGIWPARDLSQPELVRLMVGRLIEDLFPPTGRHGDGEAPLLEVAGLIDPPKVVGVDLRLRRGEIVGLAGLEGHGQDELLACLVGARRPVHGELHLDGGPSHWRSVAAMIAGGVGFVPQDRKTEGLLLEFSSIRNISLPALRPISKLGIVRASRERRLAEQAAEAVGVRGEIELPVQSLSGGNQQKVVLARSFALGAKVLILNQPTRGVDVGAKGDIYALLRSFAEGGGGVLLTSRELPEILGLCDRVLVMRNGRIVSEFARGASEETVLAAAVSGGAAA